MPEPHDRRLDRPGADAEPTGAEQTGATPSGILPSDDIDKADVAPDDVEGIVEPEPENEETKIEEVARATFGLRRYDCPTLYRETADAATDTDLPFFAVLLLSGAIATLGLLLNATAVVIGAMLVAPLLGPLLGLSLALAVGDGRLALQAGLTVVLGAIGVIALAALLTALLPLSEVTPEIASRTRPTLLDLAIAIASGLAGAVVTASREQRLSASIPGVAIAVALIPPLGAAGFGIGTGGQLDIITGPLLLFGANLAGIVLSGMGVFLLIGMHRNDVLEAAREWHTQDRSTGLSAWVENLPMTQRLRVFSSPVLRVGLVLAFMAAVAVPLTASLEQIVRENRVEAAVDEAVSELQADGRAFVLSRDVQFAGASSTVRLRVATTAWLSEAERERLEAAARRAAGENVSLVVEQVPASSGDLDALAAMLPGTTPEPVPAAPAAPEPEAPSAPATLGLIQGQIDALLDDLPLPDGARAVGAELTLGAARPSVRVVYAAERPFSEDAASMVRREAAERLGLDRAQVSIGQVSLDPRGVPLDTSEVERLGSLLERFPRLRLAVTADSATGERVRRRIAARGVAPSRVALARGAPGRARLRFDSTATP